jgi:hypothetical protein
VLASASVVKADTVPAIADTAVAVVVTLVAVVEAQLPVPVFLVYLPTNCYS